MDTVKVVISIGEASIQLEGPQEFVEKYLELYRPDASKWQTSLKTSKEQVAEKHVPKRTRTAKPKAGPSCLGSVKKLIGEGYFKEPRERSDVQKHLLSKGLRFESKVVSAALINCFHDGKLERTGVGTHAKYYSNV